MPVWTACGTAIAALFERAGLPARAGTLLYTWFLEAGLPIPECRLEYLVEGGADSLYYEWLTETMRSLLPKMVALEVLKPDNSRPRPTPRDVAAGGHPRTPPFHRGTNGRSLRPYAAPLTEVAAAPAAS